jgi:hypothetical protein
MPFRNVLHCVCASSDSGDTTEEESCVEKIKLMLELKTKGASYFQGARGAASARWAPRCCRTAHRTRMPPSRAGDVACDFAQFGSEGKVTGALQRSNGKVRRARARGSALQLRGVPQRLQDLSAVYGLETIWH